MNTVDFNVLAVRAFKTFVQAFLAALSLGLVTATNLTALKALAVGAIAAGVSAVMNLFVQPTEAK
jgi:hypothetical protein